MPFPPLVVVKAASSNQRRGRRPRYQLQPPPPEAHLGVVGNESDSISTEPLLPSLQPKQHRQQHHRKRTSFTPPQRQYDFATSVSRLEQHNSALIKENNTLKACKVEGCSTFKVARGLCGKHGAHGECQIDGCSTNAQSGSSHCGKHGKHGGDSRKVCKMEGCSTLAVARGVCFKHSACGTCTFDGCTTNAIPGSKHCYVHGGRRNKPCSVAGCITASARKGLCTKHGGGESKCWIAECTSKAVSKLKLCYKHGGFGFCAHPSGCRTPALTFGGNCRRHTSK